MPESTNTKGNGGKYKLNISDLSEGSVTSSNPIFFIASKITEKILKKFRCLRVATPEGKNS